MLKNETQIINTLDEINQTLNKLMNMILLVQEEDFLVFFLEYDEVKKKMELLEEFLTEVSKETPFFFTIKEKLYVNVISSFENVGFYGKSKSPQCGYKLEYELVPLVRILNLVIYYGAKFQGDQEKEKFFDQVEYPKLMQNTYVVESEKQKHYKYDVSIQVTGFNKVDYTKKCVESLLETLDPSLNYELILTNNGSSDGTKEYFQSIGCVKQIDYAVNDLTLSALSGYLIREGKYVCGISNDIIVGKNSIQNLLTCIQSDETHKFVIPTTTNMINNQEPALPEGVDSIKEILNWAERNNISNPYRWEHRVMLYNPVNIYRSKDFSGKNPCLIPPFSVRIHGTDGNDSVTSVLTRRSGGKCILAKDAFCYHYGSITRKDDPNLRDPVYWENKVASIEKAINISHEVTGRCYSNTLMAQIDFSDKTGLKEVLGLNCGLGSNPLKFKELHKELNHNLDCCVTNIQDTEEFALDLLSLCDDMILIQDYSALKEAVSHKKYHCIIWEDPFQISIEEEAFFQTLEASLLDGGTLLIGKPSETAKKYYEEHEIVRYINGGMQDCLVYQKK